MKKLHERYTSTKSNKTISLLIFLVAIVLSVSACGSSTTIEPDSESEVEEIQGIEEEPIDVPEEESPTEEQIEEVLSIDEIVTSFEPEASVDIPGYAGELYVVMNDNIPFFTKDNLPTTSFEYYSELDELGRCGVACANIGQDLMPTEEREGIGQIKPSGWQTIKYDNVDGKYLYNRCHLVGYQLSGENANEKNLITGTRYLNVQGMLPFENMIADYVKETDNHVLYRVAPIFDEDDGFMIPYDEEDYYRRAYEIATGKSFDLLLQTYSYIGEYATDFLREKIKLIEAEQDWAYDWLVRIWIKEG